MKTALGIVAVVILAVAVGYAAGLFDLLGIGPR